MPLKHNPSGITKTNKNTRVCHLLKSERRHKAPFTFKKDPVNKQYKFLNCDNNNKEHFRAL